MTANMYLDQILYKYTARELTLYSSDITKLKRLITDWASSCFIEILDSGSRAKGTAISLASDVDYLVSLKSDCNENSGGLKSIYESLFEKLSAHYYNVRKQNVSVRINLNGLEIDITPGKKQSGNTNDHWIYVSKTGNRQQTNIQKHINDVYNSGRLKEIKLLKIWRELHKLDFPSIYMEYLLINNILNGKSKDPNDLSTNFWYVLKQLAKRTENPLFDRVIDPSNSNNILSNLLSDPEKNKISSQAWTSTLKGHWNEIVW